MATQACKSGKVKVNNAKCKPARSIAGGEHILVDKNGLKLQFKILEILKSRVAYVIAKDCYEDLTPTKEREKFRAFYHRRRAGEDRERGLGRPTKRDRRAIENFKEIDAWFDEDIPYDFGDQE
tara:strand:- start:3435 stop:3803 length:369 start_codon:yes stop_codon:yes gene_type:complete